MDLGGIALSTSNPLVISTVGVSLVGGAARSGRLHALLTDEGRRWADGRAPAIVRDLLFSGPPEAIASALMADLADGSLADISTRSAELSALSIFALASARALPVTHSLDGGCRRAEGRLLAVHSDDADLMRGFADRYLADNLRLLSLYATTGGYPIDDDGALARERAAADAKGDKATMARKRGKYPDVKSPVSLVLDDLADIERIARDRG